MWSKHGETGILLCTLCIVRVQNPVYVISQTHTHAHASIRIRRRTRIHVCFMHMCASLISLPVRRCKKNCASYGCRECDFDSCVQCLRHAVTASCSNEQQSTYFISDYANHSLKKCSGPCEYARVQCDRCGKADLECAEWYMHCSICQYDLCSACAVVFSSEELDCDLYHGTSKQNAKSIEHGGFRQSTSSKLALGHGVYVTRNLAKAVFYGPVVLVLRVRLGTTRTITGQKDPMRTTWHEHGYDSAYAPCKFVSGSNAMLTLLLFVLSWRCRSVRRALLVGPAEDCYCKTSFGRGARVGS
jgi:hypothetical protein